MCKRFNYLKYGYLCHETRLTEAETKGEQRQSQPCKVLFFNNDRSHQKAQNLMTTLFWHEV